MSYRDKLDFYDMTQPYAYKKMVLKIKLVMLYDSIIGKIKGVNGNVEQDGELGED